MNAVLRGGLQKVLILASDLDTVEGRHPVQEKLTELEFKMAKLVHTVKLSS